MWLTTLSILYSISILAMLVVVFLFQHRLKMCEDEVMALSKALQDTNVALLVVLKNKNL